MVFDRKQALVSSFNKEKALVDAFSEHCENNREISLTPLQRPPRPAPAPPADFSVTLRLLSRRGHYSGPSSSAAAARTGFYCTASSTALDTGHWVSRRSSHSCGKSECFLPVSVVSSSPGPGAGARRRHETRPGDGDTRPSRRVRVQCLAQCGATARDLIK